MEAVSLPRNDNQKLRAFDDLLRVALRNRMRTLRDEAGTISNDMEALVGRLEDEGHPADLCDIKSARWYRTAAQLAILSQLYGEWCKIAELKPEPVFMIRQEESDDEDSVPDE